VRVPARLTSLGVVAVMGLTLTGLATSRPSHAATDPAGRAGTSGPAEVRVDSVGFEPSEVKRAYLMSSRATTGATFTVQDADGSVVWSGRVGTTSRGRWSPAYPDVYPLIFTGLRATGTYAIHVAGPVTATSQTFRIESSRALYGRIVRNGVAFFQTQRDGPDQVATATHRRPSHRNDVHASVYQLPDFVHPNRDDTIRGGLTRVPDHRVVDAEGGWFDAGDYLKFTHTTAYADVLLYASARALGGSAPASLRREARYGQTWLRRMWHERSRTLYLQVGIGSGNESGSIVGDHDLWRLPQADDHNRNPRERYAAAHRPVFEAATPGHRISPNLVGRVSAAFAVAAQADAARHRARARRELTAATTLYSRAATRHPPHPLVTSAPVSYYPESSWHDDMALGAAEIALAKLDLGQPDTTYLRDAARWTKAYLRHDSGDTFNLYDTGALAESDLLQAMRRGAHHPAIAVGRGELLASLRGQIRSGLARSRRDPFRAGGDDDDFDVDSHTFGLIATVAMYDTATESTAYQSLATAQRDWLFGANAWGASFMVGEGTNFPRCMQHQVANLSDSYAGSPPLVLGAVVNGPNSASLFDGGLGSLQSGMRRCPVGADRDQDFNGRGSEFIDDVRAWQTDEPALDMTATAILAAALEQSTTA
jgi:endoglucanase